MIIERDISVALRTKIMLGFQRGSISRGAFTVAKCWLGMCYAVLVYMSEYQ